MGIVYFDPQWSGEQLGTFQKPYVSWLNRTLQLSDTWGLKYGTTTNVPLAPFGDGGAEATRRRIGVYDPMTGAIMNGVKGGARIDATGSSMGVYIGPARAYITISGLEIFGASDYCIYKDSAAVTTEQHLWVEDCILRDSLGMGADLRGKGNKVLRTDVYSNNNDGLFIGGNDAEVGWCSIRDNGLVGATGDGVQFYNASGFYVHDTDIEHLAPSKQALIANFDSVPATTGGRIINTRMACQQYVAGVTLADQKTLMIVNPGVTVRGCTIEGGQYGAFMQGANAIFEDNVVVVNGAGSVVGVAIRAAGIKAYHNFVYGHPGRLGAYGIDHSDAGYTGTIIRNNGLIDWDRGIRTISGVTYSNNGFQNTRIRNANSAGNEGTAGTGDVVGDLKITPQHMLQVDSPLYRAGYPLGARRDRKGVRRPSAPSIGPHDPATLRNVPR